MYSCCQFQAAFISKKAFRLISSDSTIESLEILPDEDCDCFDLIESLWNGESIDIKDDNAASLVKLSQELENEELSSLVCDLQFSSEKITAENCIGRINLKESKSRYLRRNRVSYMQFVQFQCFRSSIAVSQQA